MSALTPEGRVKRMVTGTLKKYNLWYFFPAANGMGRAGIPDIIAIVAGDFVGIEVKADKTKKPTELQKICGKEIQAAGGFWFLVYDEDSCAELERYIQDKVMRHARSREGQGFGPQAEQPEQGAGLYPYG